jgi:hypothetical protein
MKRIYSAPVFAIVANVRNVLSLNGIESFITNQYLSAGTGELPPIETWPQLWVAEQDVDRALEIIEAEDNENDTSQKTWICPRCNEEVEGLFSECWNCAKQQSRCDTKESPNQFVVSSEISLWIGMAIWIAIMVVLYKILTMV